MSGSALTSAALDERRRRILFRAWRRGVREMDLIMGRFADAYLPTMNEDELAEFERLLDVPDTQALAWIVGGEQAPPPEFLTPLFARLCGSSREVTEARLDALRRVSVSLIAPAIRRLEEGGDVTLARAPEGYDAFVVAELTRALARRRRAARRDARLCRPRRPARADLYRRAELRRA